MSNHNAGCKTTYSNTKIWGFVYNVKPGQYNIKLLHTGNTQHTQPYIGYKEGALTTFEFEGEVLGNTKINDVLIPATEPSRERKYGRVSAVADDILYYMYVDSSLYNLSYIVNDGSNSNWVLKKVFEAPVEEGSLVSFYLHNHGGPGSFTANIGYYDRFGVFGVHSTNTSNWFCGTSVYSIGGKAYYSQHNTSQKNSQKDNYPMDYNRASIIYYKNSNAVHTNSYCGTKIPYSKKINSRVVATAYGTKGKLTKIKIGTSSWTPNTNNQRIYIVDSTKLVKGAKVTFESSHPSTHAGFAAVIYYVKDNKVIELPISKSNVTCSNKYAYDKNSSYRSESTLVALNPSIKHYVRVSSKSLSCYITLP